MLAPAALFVAKIFCLWREYSTGETRVREWLPCASISGTLRSNLRHLRCGWYLFDGHTIIVEPFREKAFSPYPVLPLSPGWGGISVHFIRLWLLTWCTLTTFFFFLTTFCLWQISTWILLTKVCSPTPWQMSLWTQRWLPKLLLLRVWQRPRPRSSGRSLQRFCVLAVHSGVLWGPLCLKMSWSAGCAPGKLPWEPHRICPL